MNYEIEAPEPVKPAIFDNVSFSARVEKMKTIGVGQYANAVVGINWHLLGTYDGVGYASSHELEFSEQQILAQDQFTQFADLTESQVLAWVEGCVPMKHLKYSLCNSILQSAASTATALPWSNQPQGN